MNRKMHRVTRSINMRTKCLLLGLVILGVRPGHLFAQTQWDYRDPNSAYLFHDFRARNVGDVLTIVIDEATGADSQEKREMDKKTKATSSTSGKGSSSLLGTVLRS